jgi:predicted O-linked N-acetylglucosamine transferase (SPINDLY family)/Fe-S-cluster containining protein
MDDRPPFRFPGQDPLSRRLTELEQFQERQTEAIVDADRSPKGLRASVEGAFAASEAELQQLNRVLAGAVAEGSAKPIECRPGCSHCCQRTPEATFAEATAAAAYVEESFSGYAKDALTAKLADYVRHTAPIRPAGLSENRLQCPFLESGLCSIYPARPLSCRALNSVDASVCERIAKGEENNGERPTVPAQVGILSALRTGLRLGLAFEAMDARLMDLPFVVSKLLADPLAGEQFCGGNDKLAEGLLPFDLEPFHPGELAMIWKPVHAAQNAEASGNLTIAIYEQHKLFVEQMLEKGDFWKGLESFSGNHAAHAMARIDVPRVCSSQSEILESRQRFVAAMRDFVAKGFKPEDAFDALSIHQTMNLTYQGADDLEILTEHGKMVGDIATRCFPDLSGPIPKRPRRDKLRVGYFSSNLNSSNGGRWATGWVENHGDDIETFCFLIGKRYDAVSERFKRESDHFYWLLRSVPENARFVRSLGLDVLIFTDIGLHARNTQYSSLRLAPVQCTAWGHPETSGLSTIDYYLSSDMMEPADGDASYTEKLVRLPRTGLCYPRISAEPSRLDRSDFGVPEAEPFVLMAQASLKLLPHHDYLYARICERTGAPLVILESNAQGDTRILKQRLENAGVPTRWLPYQNQTDYLALLKAADVSLDPPMWSGGNTTIQALTFGTPVVTLPGPFMRARHSYAMLQLAGAPGLIAEDEDDYVDLASNPDRQREAMAILDPEPLYEDFDVVKSLDENLWKMADGLL